MNHNKLDAMHHYLDWLHERYGDGFALVLDIYSPHKKIEVKDNTPELQIDLIYVPANGTPKYHPLNRMLFGIIKKNNKARRYDPMSLAKNQNLYHASYEQMRSSMNDLSANANAEAWNIHKLEEYLDEVREFDDSDDQVGFGKSEMN